MLSPEEARQLVEREGNISAAARSIGAPRSSFKYWLDPEAVREHHRRRYHADPEPKKQERRRYYAENREREREAQRRYWENLSGPAYNRRLLQMRRVNALRRMAERKRRTAEEAS